MSPFKSSKGRNLGKMLEGFKSSDIGKGFGSGGDVVKATGGTKITVDEFTYHIFNEFVAAPYMEFTANVDLTCDWLVLGAGGGGSVQHSAGGGAGGLRSSLGPGGPNPSPEQQITIPAGTTCPVSIGAGGARATTGPNGGSPDGGAGGHTILTIPTGTPIRAEGGGGAPSWDPNSGNWGGCGSGGGAPGNTSAGQGNYVAHTSTPVTNQGFPGGNCPGPTAHGGGGGGGAGAAGTASSGDGSGGVTAGPGGAGKQLPGFPTAELMTAWPASYYPRITPISNNAYGGGGGGGAHGNNNKATGGNGGGGNGNQASNGSGEDGLAGFGGGGGGSGAYNSNPGGAGGSGIVIIRYSE